MLKYLLERYAPWAITSTPPKEEEEEEEEDTIPQKLGRHWVRVKDFSEKSKRKIADSVVDYIKDKLVELCVHAMQVKLPVVTIDLLPLLTLVADMDVSFGATKHGSEFSHRIYPSNPLDAPCQKVTWKYHSREVSLDGSFTAIKTPLHSALAADDFIAELTERCIKVITDQSMQGMEVCAHPTETAMIILDFSEAARKVMPHDCAQDCKKSASCDN
jgi:hypothetical protein